MGAVGVFGGSNVCAVSQLYLPKDGILRCGNVGSDREKCVQMALLSRLSVGNRNGVGGTCAVKKLYVTMQPHLLVGKLACCRNSNFANLLVSTNVEFARCNQVGGCIKSKPITGFEVQLKRLEYDSAVLLRSLQTPFCWISKGCPRNRKLNFYVACSRHGNASESWSRICGSSPMLFVAIEPRNKKPIEYLTRRGCQSTTIQRACLQPVQFEVKTRISHDSEISAKFGSEITDFERACDNVHYFGNKVQNQGGHWPPKLDVILLSALSCNSHEWYHHIPSNLWDIPWPALAHFTESEGKGDPLIMSGCCACDWTRVAEKRFFQLLPTRRDSSRKGRDCFTTDNIYSLLLSIGLILLLNLTVPLFGWSTVSALETPRSTTVTEVRSDQNPLVPNEVLRRIANAESISQGNLLLLANASKEQTGALKGREMHLLAEGRGVCEETYGFLPCSVSAGGNLSLIVVYGYLLLLAAQQIAKGSELLLEVMNPGLLGGLLLPILGALPDALLIFASGTGGTVSEAQEQVMVGIGVLAGSTVMILTLGWAGSLFAGRCDLSGPNGTAVDLVLTKRFNWLGTGVSNDEQTRVGAWIMVVSTVPYLFVQIPLLDGHPAEGPEAALVGCIIAILGLLTYCSYQISFPWLQQKRIEEARLQLLRSRALHGVTSFYSGFGERLSLPWKGDGLSLSTDHLKGIFSMFDKNKDGKIQQQELEGLLVGLGLEDQGYVPRKEQLELWLAEFDVDVDGSLSEHEFLAGISKWTKNIFHEKLSQKFQNVNLSTLGVNDPNFWAARSDDASKVLEALESEVMGSENALLNESELFDSRTIYTKAVIFLGAGAGLAAVFADPLVDSIKGFSTASGVPPFFVAFVITPLASNASELFSSITFARTQRKKNISLTFSQLYGAVTMNNTLCLGLFLGVVYIRGLNWVFSSEVAVILLAVFVVGAVGGSRTTFPLWVTVPVIALYPICIGIVAFLDNVLGWQ